jgi:hypothetical protein
MFQGPVLQLDEDPDLVFPLSGPFTDGYHNDIAYGFESMNYRSHYTIFGWQKGYFKPMTIELNLAVGLDDGGKGFLETPERLQTVLSKLLALSVIERHGSGQFMPLRAVRLRVGEWFRRQGYMQDIDFTFMPPWDIDTGAPLRAEVRFMFMPDFLADSTYRDTQQLPVSSDFKRGGFSLESVGRGKNPGFATGGLILV